MARGGVPAAGADGDELMRAVRVAAGSVAVIDVPAPGGEGHRVRIRSAGVCGSDLHMVTGEFAVRCTLGHEFAGVLDDGAPVAVEPIVPCERCDFCRAGAYNLCRDGLRTILGVGRDGGMADEVVVPQRCLLALPNGVSAADGCLVEPLAVTVHGLRKAQLRADMRVAVIGGGTIGLCAVAVAASHTSAVGLLARHPAQQQAGRTLGATELRGEYDLVVECAGTESALDSAAQWVRPGGTILLLATYWNGAHLPAMAMGTKELSLVAASMYGTSAAAGRDFAAAAQLLADNPRIAPTLITHRFPLQRAREAFAAAADRRSGAIKVVLEPASG